MQNFPKKSGGQQGPRSSDFAKKSYPLQQRENELRGEIQSPTIPTIYERMMTLDNVSENSGSGNPVKPVTHGLKETWDSVAPLVEDNMHQKFVNLSTEDGELENNGNLADLRHK